MAGLALIGASRGATAAYPRSVLVLGDSLSAEYGLPRDTGWAKLLSGRLAAREGKAAHEAAGKTASDAANNAANKAKNKTTDKTGKAGEKASGQYIVVNASISGETTSGGRGRLPALLKQHRPAVVIIELGANDALRGLPLSTIRDNLRAMIAAGRNAGARVLLVGMRIPPNYGRDYSEGFAALFPDLARELNISLVPFLFEGFGDQLEFFQPDRIHPTAAAQVRMLDNVWPQLAPLLAPAR